MSVPPDKLTALMAGGGGGGGAKPPMSPEMMNAPGGNQPPSGGPMSTPQPKEGLQQAAMVKISMTLQMLEQALPAFGSASEQGKAILNALKTLTNTFGKSRAEGDKMIPAELMELVQGMKGGPAAQTMGGTPPTQPTIPQGAPA